MLAHPPQGCRYLRDDFFSHHCSAPCQSQWERAPRDWDLKLVDEWKWEESGDALLSYGVLAGTLALGASGWLSGFRDGDLPYFIALAICTIYIGAHRGLTSKTRQNISLGQGAAAPVLASVSLFGLYLLVRFLPDIDLQSILNAYFWLLGAFSVAGALPGPLATLLGPLSQAKVSLPVPEGLLIDQEGEYITQGDLTLPGVLSLLIG